MAVFRRRAAGEGASRWHPDKARRGAGSLVYSLLVLCAVAIVLGLSMKFRYAWDLSRARDNALTPQTLKLLGGLKEDVHVYALFTPREPHRDKYVYLLMEYEKASSHVKVQFIDPVSRPGLVKELGVGAEAGAKRDGLTVVARGERKIVFRGVEEDDVTNAILEVGAERKKVVGFLRGYGEHDPTSSSESGLLKAADALRQEYYDVRDVALVEGIPADVTVLVAAGPTMPIPPPDLDKLSRWLEAGGRMCVLVDPGSETGIEEVLKPWGLKVSGNKIVEPDLRDNVNRQPDFIKITRYSSHAIGRGFGKNFPTIFPLAQAVAHFEPGDPEVYHDAIASTSDFAIGLAPDNSRIQGPFDVAVASWKRQSGGQLETETRIVLVGDSDFATNAYLVAVANRNFFLNCLGWLSREQGLVSIRRQPLEGQQLELRRGDRWVVMCAVFGSPVLIILAGVVVFVRRRRL